MSSLTRFLNSTFMCYHEFIIDFYAIQVYFKKCLILLTNVKKYASICLCIDAGRRIHDQTSNGYLEYT
jgi:hypothetical protein